MILRAAFASVLPCLAAAPVASEGARAAFDCTRTRVCDGKGTCRVSDRGVTFELAPTAYGDGVQSYDLTYDDATVTARQRGDVSQVPIQWQTEDARHLMLAVPGGFVWIRQSNATRDTEIGFLSCAAR